MAKKRKHNKSSKGIIIGTVVLLAVTGVAVGIKAYKDHNGGLINPIVDNTYVINTKDKAYSLSQLDVTEKMYIKNEGKLDLSEINSLETYKNKTLSTVIKSNYTLDKYKEDNASIKLYSAKNVRLEKDDTFTISHKELGNLLESTEVDLSVEDYILTAGSDMLTTSVKYDFIAKHDGSYDFYLIENEKDYELLVDYSVPKGYTGSNAFILPDTFALVGGMNNWTVDNVDYPMTGSINHTFSYLLDNKSDSLEFKIVADKSWDWSYGGDSLITEAGYVHESYGNLKVTQPGLYKIKVDILHGQVSVEQKEYYDLDYHLTLVGDMNNWNQGDSTYKLIKTNTPGLFEIEYSTLQIPTKFKIVKDNSWDTQFGFSNLNAYDDEYISPASDDNNILIDNVLGKYLIQLDMKTGKINVELIENYNQNLSLLSVDDEIYGKNIVLDCQGIEQTYLELFNAGGISGDVGYKMFSVDFETSYSTGRIYSLFYTNGYVNLGGTNLSNLKYFVITINEELLSNSIIVEFIDTNFAPYIYKVG